MEEQVATQQLGVIGLGSWGTALAQHLCAKGFEVIGWSRDAEAVAALNSTHRNPHFLPERELDPKLNATTELDEVLERSVVVVALPSHTLGELGPKLGGTKAEVFVSAIKGLERGTLETPLQAFERYLPASCGLATLSGPSFARDVVAGKPCGIVAASKRPEVAERVADLFNNGSMRVYTSNDAIGVELGGVVKNVVAIACGVIDALGLGDSARAGLITRGLAEMMRLAGALGAQPITLSGLSGLGDLVMTATCDQSRNRTLGLRLGRGDTLSQILATLGSTAEGAETAALVLELGKRNGVELPITEHVVALLEERITAPQFVGNLMARPRTVEFRSTTA